MAWRYGEKRSYCETCQDAGRQKGIERDCGSCPYRPPDIHPGIRDFYSVACACESQVRAGVGGAYGLDWTVVFRVAEARGIEVDRRFVDLLKIFEAAMMKEINKK